MPVASPHAEVTLTRRWLGFESPPARFRHRDRAAAMTRLTATARAPARCAHRSGAARARGGLAAHRLLRRCGRSTACSPRAARTSTSTWARWSRGRATPASARRSIRRSPPGWSARGSRSFRSADWAYYLFAMVLATFALWVAWRVSEALSRRREARRRPAAAHLHSVLQFPCAEIQRQHGADPALGARPPGSSCAPSKRAARSGRRSPALAAACRHDGQILVDLPARRASASRRSPTRAAATISARRRPG